jgi:hypothetical protein
LEPKKLSGQIRGDLDWIAMKCLEKGRNRRYETPNGLALDVQRYLAGEAVLACPPSMWYRLRKFGLRHKASLWATGAAVLVLVMASAGGTWVLWDQAARRAELAGRTADTEKAVTAALAKAGQSVDRAGRQRSATSVEAQAALMDWREAEAAVVEAEAALTTGAPGDVLRELVAATRSRIELGRAQLQRKEKLFRDLDEARLARSVWVDNDFNYAGSSAKYAAAFAAYDINVSEGPGGDLARQLRAAEPEVRDALIVALDDWAFTAAKANKPSLSTDLRTLARATDNDPWRQRFRAATGFALPRIGRH